MPSPEDLELLLGPLGLTVAVIVALIAFAREWVVPGARVKRLEGLIDRFALLTESSTDTVKQLTQALEERNNLDEQLLKRLGARK